MIFNLIKNKDKFLEETYEEGLKRLNKFFGMDFKKGKIEILIVKDRKTIDLLKGQKTEKWLVGWINGTCVFILDRKNFTKESSNPYSDESYKALIIHEMCHVYYNIFSHGRVNPSWLCEGVSIYISNQNKFKKKPKRFIHFLESYYEVKKDVYNEAGFFVEFLIKKFDKNRLSKLIKLLDKINSKIEFENLFKKIYRFSLNYDEINKKWREIQKKIK